MTPKFLDSPFPSSRLPTLPPPGSPDLPRSWIPHPAPSRAVSRLLTRFRAVQTHPGAAPGTGKEKFRAGPVPEQGPAEPRPHEKETSSPRAEEQSSHREQLPFRNSRRRTRISGRDTGSGGKKTGILSGFVSGIVSGILSLGWNSGVWAVLEGWDDPGWEN